MLPLTTAKNQNLQLTFFKIIFDYAVFAFGINLLRETAKDIEDINGDYKAGMNALPIAIGRERAKKVLAVLNFVPLIGVVIYIISSLYKQPIFVGYFLLFVVGPQLYICLKTFNANTKKDFSHLSSMYKLVMLFGMLSLLLYKYVILN